MAFELMRNPLADATRAHTRSLYRSAYAVLSRTKLALRFCHELNWH